jgi:hypothetical protein
MIKAHRLIGILWLIFSLIFFGMAGFHYYLSKRSAPDFETVALNGCSNGICVETSIRGVSLDKPLQDFAVKFNGYLHEQNHTSRLENLAAVAGYILAGLTALISLFLEIMAIKEKNRGIANSSADNS